MRLNVSLVEETLVHIAYEDRPLAMINGKLHEPAELSSTRHSYLYEDLIIKVDNHTQAHSPVEQGKAEVRVWENLSEKERGLFVPLVTWGEVKPGVFWVAQKFIEHNEYDTANEMAIEHFNDVMNKYTITDYDASQDLVINCLITDTGEIKIYDWGCNGYEFNKSI